MMFRKYGDNQNIKIIKKSDMKPIKCSCKNILGYKYGKKIITNLKIENKTIICPKCHKTNLIEED